MFSIKKQELQKLIDKKLTDTEICKLYNVSQQVIYYHRLKVHKINRKSLRTHIPYNLNKTQMELIFGTVLGDGYLKNKKYDLGTSLMCAHSTKQEDYVKYKASFFSNKHYSLKNYTRITPNKITNKIYTTTLLSFKANENLNYFHEKFYIDNKKVIPIDLLEKYYTPLAMSIHFMDDGSKVGNSGYMLHTCSFLKENIKEFMNFLKIKYNVETSLQTLNRLYIRKKSKEVFKKTVKPYICDSMLYKL